MTEILKYYADVRNDVRVIFTLAGTFSTAEIKNDAIQKVGSSAALEHLSAPSFEKTINFRILRLRLKRSRRTNKYGLTYEFTTPPRRPWPNRH